jgi:UDP-glucose 4-epimerase
VLTRYFSLPVVPTVLGFDARIQLLHSEDALAVLEQAALRAGGGVFNAGGDGALMLSQAIRRAGRLQLPMPVAAIPTAGRLLRGARLIDFNTDHVRYLNHGRIVDTTRLRTVFGFTPRWTTRQAFDDYVHGSGMRPLFDLSRLAGLERRVLGTQV